MGSYFPVNYYAFAVAFLLFEIEVAFLIPWAVTFYRHGWGAFAAAVFFLMVLLFGLWYGFRSEVLKWD